MGFILPVQNIQQKTMDKVLQVAFHAAIAIAVQEVVIPVFLITFVVVKPDLAMDAVCASGAHNVGHKTDKIIPE
jgi:hypothetical protein